MIRTSVGGLQRSARSASRSLVSRGGQTGGAGPTWPAARRAVFTSAAAARGAPSSSPIGPRRRAPPAGRGGPPAPGAWEGRARCLRASAGQLWCASGWHLLSRPVRPGAAAARAHAGLSLTPSGSGTLGGREPDRLAGGAEAEREPGPGRSFWQSPPAGGPRRQVEGARVAAG